MSSVKLLIKYENTFQNAKKAIAKTENPLNPIEEYFEINIMKRKSNGIIHTKEREIRKSPNHVMIA
jgi:hypothetical protein